MDFASLNGHHGGNSNGGAPPSMPSLDNIGYYDDETFDRNVAAATEAHELTRLTRQQYEEALRILRQSQLQLPPSQPLPQLLQKLPQQQHQMQPSQQQSSTSQLLMQPPSPPPPSPPPAVTKATKKRKVTTTVTSAPRRNRPPATGGKKTKISQPSVIAATNAATTTTSSTVKQQQQQRSFHSFVETLNCYNLLPCDWQQTLVASWKTDEVKLYTGRTQIHRNHHDQFHLLCQGTNVNPDCVKRQVAQKIQGLINGDSRTITVVTDQMALRFVHLWYAYATPATCALESTSVPNVVELLTTIATQDQQQLLVQIDNRLGRMCHLCMEYFLRFINGDRLYPSQQRPSQPQYLPLAQVPSPYRPPPPQPSSPQPPLPQVSLPQLPPPQLQQPPPQLPSPATKKRKTAAATTVTPASSSAATASTESTVADVRVTGLGAARKKISAAAPLPSSSGGNSQQQQPSPSRLRLDDNVSYMSDYAMSTSDDDEDEYSDYDDQADNGAAATTDNSGPMTDGGAPKKKQ